MRRKGKKDLSDVLINSTWNQFAIICQQALLYTKTKHNAPQNICLIDSHLSWVV